MDQDSLSNLKQQNEYSSIEVFYSNNTLCYFHAHNCFQVHEHMAIHSVIIASYFLWNYLCKQINMLSLVMIGSTTPVSRPPKICRTRFVGVFIEKLTIQLQWNPVNESAPECSNEVQYNVSYRGCSNGTSWIETKFTTNTSIEFRLNENEIKNLVFFSVEVSGSNFSSNLTVNFENNTGMDACML